MSFLKSGFPGHVDNSWEHTLNKKVQTARVAGEKHYLFTYAIDEKSQEQKSGILIIILPLLVGTFRRQEPTIAVVF